MLFYRAFVATSRKYLICKRWIVVARSHVIRYLNTVSRVRCENSAVISLKTACGHLDLAGVVRAEKDSTGQTTTKQIVFSCLTFPPYLGELCSFSAQSKESWG